MKINENMRKKDFLELNFQKKIKTKNITRKIKKKQK